MKKVYVSAPEDTDLKKLTELISEYGVDAVIPTTMRYPISPGEKYANWLKRHFAETNIRASDEVWIFGEMHGESFSDWQYSIHLRKTIRYFDKDFNETGVLKI